MLTFIISVSVGLEAQEEQRWPRRCGRAGFPISHSLAEPMTLPSCPQLATSGRLWVDDIVCKLS